MVVISRAPEVLLKPFVCEVNESGGQFHTAAGREEDVEDEQAIPE